MPDESERRGLAGCVITKGLGGKIVEAARGGITLDLAIPGRPVVLQKPGAKLPKLVRRERLDVLLDLLDFAHKPSTRDLSLASAVLKTEADVLLTCGIQARPKGVACMRKLDASRSRRRFLAFLSRGVG